MRASDRGRWGVLVFALCYTSFTYGLVVGGFAFWVDPWRTTFNVSHSLTMVAFTAASLVMALSAPLIGRALDHIPVRNAMIAGSVMLAIGLAFAALASSFWALFAVYTTIVPIGAALAGSLPASVFCVRTMPQRTGLVNGLLTLGIGLSAVLVAIFTSLLMPIFGWRGTFLIAAAAMLGLIAPLGWFLLSGAAGAPAARDRLETSEKKVSDEFSPLRERSFWVIVFAAVPIMLLLGAISPNLAAIGIDAGLDSSKAAIPVSVLSIGAAAGAIIGGWLCDRLPFRILYAFMLATAMAVVLLLATRPVPFVLVPALGLLGFVAGSSMPWAAAMVTRSFGADRFGRTIGLLTLFFLPATFCPILFGWIRDVTGGYQLGFLIFAGLLTPGGAALYLMRRTAPPLSAGPVAGVSPAL